MLTIEGLGAMTKGGKGGKASGMPAANKKRAVEAARQEGFKAGVGRGPRRKLAVQGASSSDLAELQASYDSGYKRGAASGEALGVPVDGNGVPGIDPPGDGPKGGGPVTILCGVDSGKGGWREVGGRWHYGHHEGCILSSLAARYLGDAGAWKVIWNGSKEKGLLPPGSTPDRIPVRDPATGERVNLWLPDEGIERARELGCIPPAGVAGALSKMSTGAKLALAGAVCVGGYLLVSNG